MFYWKRSTRIITYVAWNNTRGRWVIPSSYKDNVQEGMFIIRDVKISRISLKMSIPNHMQQDMEDNGYPIYVIWVR